ncbi:MAG: ABC transporter permease [Opitutaceae bacterium]|jgi:sulfonate transport system permease protein
MNTFLGIYRSPRFRAFAPLLVVLVLWWLATSRGWVSTLILVPFDRLWAAVEDPLVRHNLLSGLLATSLRLFQGYLIGVSIGLALGIGMGLSPVCDRIMGPSFHAVRQVAIFGWIPLLTSWFGNGDIAKIAFVAIGAAKPVVMGTYEGIRSVPQQYRELGRVLGFSRSQMLRKIILPSALPSITSGLQLSLIFSWFAAIGAEYAIGVLSAGIGSVVMSAQEQFRTDVVLVGVIIISVVGITTNRLLRKIPKHFFAWKESA